MRYELLVFDVNETLLDLSPMADVFAEALGPEVSPGEWFSRLLHQSLVANEVGVHRPFDELGVDSLLWLAGRRSIPLSRPRAEEVVAELKRLPPHPDVAPGLESLHGRRLVALTNGRQASAAEQLSNAGLDGYFERVLSVEAIGRFKPHPDVYRQTAEGCEVEIERMLLVAAHDWDVAGAQAAGAGGCFVRRQPWGQTGVAPHMEIDDIRGLAEALEE